MRSISDERRDQAIQGRQEPAEVSPGSLQSARRPCRLLGPPIPMIARMIVESFRAATIIRCRFATLASPLSHGRLAPPVSQTWAKDHSASSLRSRDSCFPLMLCVRLRIA